jgi:ribose 5-phosphate isomerase A
MSPQDQLKIAAARKAMDYLVDGSIIGVGTGSTVNFFIQELAAQKHRVKAAVSSSSRSTDLLRSHGITVLDLNDVETYPIYVDGADEINYQRHMIKGGGAALTREKVVAAQAERFICIVDSTKVKKTLGAFALPVEVIPMARNQVARELIKLGGQPSLRAGVVTDNGNEILDVAGLQITDPVAFEQTLNQITGVVCNGLFAVKPASLAIVASAEGLTVMAD